MSTADPVMNETDRLMASLVKSHRTAMRMSQNALAATLSSEGLKKFHAVTVSRIEAGTQPLRLDEALAMARILGIDMASVFADNARPTIHSRSIAAASALRLLATQIELGAPS